MTRSLLDSTVASDIPAEFRGLPTLLVAGYVDGSFAWLQEDWDLHADAGRRLVRVAIHTDRFDAHVLDVEEGNAYAGQAVPWIRGKWARGETPTVYCYSDAGPVGYRISDVRAACENAVPPVAPPLFWIAKWDDDPSSFDPAGDPAIVAKQYAGSAQTGAHFDASVVADHWPGVDKEAVMTPEFIGQSAPIVVLKPGEVGTISGIWDWGGTIGRRTISRKVYGRKVGSRPDTLRPPAEPDADWTQDLDAQPALFIVTVSDL